MPVTPEAQASPLYEAGVSCPACHDQRDAGQRAGYAERQRQVTLAAARGAGHLGVVPPVKTGVGDVTGAPSDVL